MKFKSGKLPINIGDRLKYLYRLKEVLRLFHNEKGKNYRDEEITLDEFRNFQRTWFRPRELLVCESINACRSILKEDKTTICDVKDIEEN